MAKSLAEMRQSPAVGLPERTKLLCLAQALVSKAQSLADERESLRVDHARDQDDKGPPKRSGEGSEPPRVKEIDAELEALWAEMREHTGELLLRGTSSGDWRRWAQAHPARQENKGTADKPNWVTDATDAEVAYGFCNADDLLADLDRYAVAWNGDPLGEGDWEFIANRAAPGDLKEVARIVVQMHETEGVKAPKASPRPSSGSQPNANGSSSPAASASASDDSSAGSLPSDTSTSTPKAS